MVAVVEMAAPNRRIAPELGDVGYEHDRSAIGRDGLPCLDFVDVKIEQRAVQFDAADAEDPVIGTEAREEVCGGFADDVPIQSPERAARNRDFHVGIVCERRGDIQAVSDHPEIMSAGESL